MATKTPGPFKNGMVDHVKFVMPRCKLSHHLRFPNNTKLLVHFQWANDHIKFVRPRSKQKHHAPSPNDTTLVSYAMKDLVGTIFSFVHTFVLRTTNCDFHHIDIFSWSNSLVIEVKTLLNLFTKFLPKNSRCIICITR